MLFWIFISQMIVISALPPVIKIGAIITEDYKGGTQELAFKYAVYRINKERSILPHTTLVYDIQYVPAHDTFQASKKACAQVKSGVLSIFLAGNTHFSSTLGALCASLNVPHVQAAPAAAHLPYTVSLHPTRPLLNKAFVDLISYLNLTRMALLYEDTGYGELDTVGVAADGRDVYARRCSSPAEYRHALAEIRAQRIEHILLDTSPVHIHRLFRAILQLQMNSEDYHYIFTSFDMDLIDLEDFYYNRVNMSGWRLVDRDAEKVKETLQFMEKFHPIGVSMLDDGHIKTEPALLYDGVQALALGLSAFDAPLQTTNLSCDAEQPWEDGSTLITNINSITTQGLTGPIEFKDGQRTEFKLQLMRLEGGEKGGSTVAGHWTPSRGLHISDPDAYRKYPSTNITLIVVTREEKPYVMVKEGWNLQGNARFEGFCVDLLARVASRAGFHYRLRLVPDNMYGARDPNTGQWNGIVRELMDRKADLAVASMTINYAREAVIDFTKPFMNLGIGILFKVPKSQPTRLFSFLNPLAVEIWLYVLAAYILVSFTLFVMARFSPYEWSHGQHQCGHESKLLVNQFNVSNSFWFMIGTFLRQGSGINPKATSTRIVGGIWWFFTLIILSSYTANLAAFLTVERTVLPIQSAADLAAQTNVRYGTLSGGSTMTFFRDSNIDIYQQMWKHMSTANTLVSSYEEGVRRVLQGEYAFLMESTMLDHRVQRDCNLTQLGGLLDSKGYGIATHKGSPWRDKISLAILELQEKGVIQILYDKWWKNTGDVCNREGKDSKANPLGVQNIGGVFVVLLCGLAIAILVAILEFCWNTKKHAAQERQSLCSEMGQELRQAVRGTGSARSALRPGCSRCSVAATYVPPPHHYNGEAGHSVVEMKELRWS